MKVGIHNDWHREVGQLQCRKCLSWLDSEALSFQIWMALSDLEFDLEGRSARSHSWILSHGLVCFVNELSEELGCSKFGTFFLDYVEFVLADSTELLLSLRRDCLESEVGCLELDELAVEQDAHAPVQQFLEARDFHLHDAALELVESAFGRNFHLICI